MRAAVITGRQRLEVKEFPFPEAAEPRTAVVEIGRCGICGSDVAAYHDGRPYPPALSGHEWGGTIVAVGAGVRDLAVGDRVVKGDPPACGRCKLCLAGIYDRCEGVPIANDALAPPHGGYAERVVFPADRLIRIPDELDEEQAAMVEPAAVAVHAVRLRPPVLGETVLILGAGPIGLFAAQVARVAGASRVLVVEPHERRRALACEIGADGAVAPGNDAIDLVFEATGGRGADLVIDCSGSDRAFLSAPELCRPGATIMLVAGVPPVKVVPRTWLMKQLNIATSRAHVRHEFAITIDLIITGRIATQPLHSLTIGLDELEDTFDALSRGEHVKVLVDPRANAASRGERSAKDAPH